MEYNEKDAISFISSKLPYKIDETTILYIIDLIWDYYEKTGTLEISFDIDEEDVDIDELIKYVTTEVNKSALELADENIIKDIVVAEIAYEETLDVF